MNQPARIGNARENFAEEDEEPGLAAPERRGISIPVLITLASLSAIIPLATDLYLPAFPIIERALGTTAAGVQLSLTAFLVGAAAGQLFFGPISDRWGRVRPIVYGTLACAAASAAAAFSPTIAYLVAARFVQGIAGSAGIVIGRAMISDLAADQWEAARAFNIMMAVIGIAPIIAPWLGSVLVGPLGWRGTLWVIFGLTLAIFVAVLLWIREPHLARPAAPALDSMQLAASPLASLLVPSFLGNTFAFGLAFAAFMAYISASPFLFQVIIGLSVIHYGQLFAFITLIMTLTSVVSAHLAHRIPAKRLLGFGLAALLFSSVAVAGIVFLQLPSVWTILPLATAVGSLGFILGNAASAAIAAASGAAGTGSAILGALQFGLGALTAPLVGLCGERTAVPLAITMCAASSLALISFLFAERSKPAG